MLLNCCGGILPNDKQYDRYAKLVEEIEEKCLKKSRHVPPKDAIYETPSDYDPLALNMGQLVVHRISLRFCDAVISSLSLLSSSLFLAAIVILTTKLSRSLRAGASAIQANSSTASAVEKFCHSNIRSEDIGFHVNLL